MEAPPVVFLSAVTKDFGLPFLDRLRTIIHDELGCVCRYRGNLKQGTAILPEKLRGEIEGAGCVIHLVGPSLGYGPEDVQQPDAEITPAGESWKPACKSWWPFADLPARRSYTQMEYDFATQLGRPVYVIFVDAPALIAAAAAQPPADAALQAGHRSAIKAHGHEYVTTDSVATVEDIAGKLRFIVEHLKKQIVEYRDAIASVNRKLRPMHAIAVATLVALIGAGIYFGTRERKVADDTKSVKQTVTATAGTLTKVEQTATATADNLTKVEQTASATAGTLTKVEQTTKATAEEVVQLKKAVNNIDRKLDTKLDLLERENELLEAKLQQQGKALADFTPDQILAELVKHQKTTPDELKLLLEAALASNNKHTRAQALSLRACHAL